MCMHRSYEEFTIETGSGVYPVGRNKPVWALERYLLWAKSTLPGPRGYEKSVTEWEEHKMKVEESMIDPDLKVWME